MATSVVQRLYDNYVASGDRTPSEHVSSHWRALYAASSLALHAGALRVEGCGFDVRRPSLLARAISRGIAVLHWAALPRQRVHVLRVLPLGRQVARRCGLIVDHSALTQIVALLTIRAHLPAPPRVILNIGDGRGYLSALLKTIYPAAQVVLVDLGKSLLVQAHFLGRAFASARHRFAHEEGEADFVYCPAEDIERLPRGIDLAINIASMQEMNDLEVARYFRFLRDRLNPDGLFYCSNRVEKRMVGGEISRFDEYPWDPYDTHLVDELSPAYRFGFTTQAWYRDKRGPQLFGVQVPFLTYFDPIKHRLSRLHPSVRLKPDTTPAGPAEAGHYACGPG